ncbi:HAD-IA family hydrolase [Testudinibacter sp. TR-2022]|uniref:HAD-IA family hydrolase n=1 Tax=Testudinibacter sp. TR-2022 TaxID=2585029 RepID=UPI001119BE4B|nr:HAD-IA family hydrolase [Testudinibacter sp. TR-2022]TNH01581.1 HAD-IA family hydrolase [Pasteurellaceae bacterium Phil31]TNH04308.1 HAD-IA family hydrolase [Testudinibacter sp. TR-2022]TNH09284.1 HAD-IA family hydrolase [Testudinibacter sp. TR-2022]TNH12992.1 HAD-IA family hydrolase [Testudinibacter sp. TR-2022]TNH14864.1 HAD-IA family hydrolase [Testudinibacter sp. TR-2022]
MRFYRQLQPFNIISFDLDDTLYYNRSVIAEAEKQFLCELQRLAGLPHLTAESWGQVKRAVAVANPLIMEDVVHWRKSALVCLLQQSAVAADKVEEISNKVMAHFIHWRHQIALSPQTKATLDSLAQRYPLAVITNGNVDPKKIGLTQFSLCLRGGEHGRAKPHFDLFAQTAAHFNVRSDQILHVGDNLQADVQGAVQAGCQAVWLNLNSDSLLAHQQSRNLPHVELTNLKQLLLLA